MKKIMFDDRFGLTEAVLEGRKTQTRRTISDKLMIDAMTFGGGEVRHRNVGLLLHAPFKVGDVVAVAQRYSEIYPNADFEMIGKEFLTESPGWNNKMFVRADLMPHQIRITNIRLERLQDISDEDCMREGVEKWMDCYIVTGIMYRDGKSILCFDTPREAFAALIDKISGPGTWQRNPYVFAYTFELIVGHKTEIRR